MFNLVKQKTGACLQNVRCKRGVETQKNMDKVITTFVDNGIEWLRQKELLMRPDPDMPVEMFDTTRKNSDDWRPWKAINSTVTEQDISEIENAIKHRLPNSYIEYLKYKHFYEVRAADSFEPFDHTIHRWKETLMENIFHPELKEFMLDSGYIWFGNYQDWGFLCFDTNKKSIDNNYPVVLIDHETIEDQQTLYKDFLDCLQKNTVTL
jgi:hypothetical protein